MAVLLSSARDDVFERVEALTGIARTILDIRLLLGLLAAFWMLLRGADNTVLLVMLAAMAWLLLVLLRWRTLGRVVCTHPVVLAVDALLCFAGLAATEVMSPLILLLGSSALMTGLCLDRRGAAFFAPLMVAGWWVVYTATPPAGVSAPDVFVQVAGVPVLLVGVSFLGAGIRATVLSAAEVERELRVQMRSAGVAEERARMAREMHDSLIKSLHGLALLADSVPGWIDRSPDRAQDQARRLSDLIRVAGRESREMVLAMRRADARDRVADQVRETVERWRATSNRSVVLTTEGDPDLATEPAYELVAVLGEALENIRRHTPEEAAVVVTLTEDHGWLRLVVTDNGPGMPRRAGPRRAAGALRAAGDARAGGAGGGPADGVQPAGSRAPLWRCVSRWRRRTTEDVGSRDVPQRERGSRGSGSWA